MLGSCLGWLVGLALGINGRSELDFWNRRVLGTIIGAVDGPPLGICDGIVIGSLEDFIYEDLVGKFECLLLGTWLGSVVGLVLGYNEGMELGLWDGKVLGRTLGDLFGQ